MLPVFVDELNLWLLSLCARAVRLGSGIGGCSHITDGLKVFCLSKTPVRKWAVLETNFVVFQLSSEL